MKMHRYFADWFDTNGTGVSTVKYAAGKAYPVSDETSAHVAQGHAEEIDVEPDVDTAAKKAARAKQAADRAVEAAAEAQRMAEAAVAAAAELARQALEEPQPDASAQAPVQTPAMPAAPASTDPAPAMADAKPAADASAPETPKAEA